MCSTICLPWKCVLFRNTFVQTIDAPPRDAPRCQARTSAAFSQYWRVESTLDLIFGTSPGSRLFADNDMGGKGGGITPVPAHTFPFQQHRQFTLLQYSGSIDTAFGGRIVAAIPRQIQGRDATPAGPTKIRD